MDSLDFLSNALRGDDFSNDVIDELLALLNHKHETYEIIARTALQLMTNEIWLLRHKVNGKGGDTQWISQSEVSV